MLNACPDCKQQPQLQTDRRGRWRVKCACGRRTLWTKTDRQACGLWNVGKVVKGVDEKL